MKTFCRLCAVLLATLFSSAGWAASQARQAEATVNLGEIPFKLYGGYGSREKVFGIANGPARASVYDKHVVHTQDDHEEFEVHVLLGFVIAHETRGIMQLHWAPQQSRLLRAAAQRHMWQEEGTLENYRMMKVDLTARFTSGRGVADVSSARMQDPENRPDSIGASLPGPAAEVPVDSLDLPATPAGDAYAVTGNLLPPFLKAVVSLWNQKFPGVPLSNNSLLFVIRPSEFYADLNAQQKIWLMSREMLGIRNFPLIINPLTPDDDWYFRAQQEWKRGNFDAVYILVTSLFHEIAHTQHAADELVAYRDQLALFERFEKQGKLSSPYAHACRASLRERYLDVKRNPQQYRQVLVKLRDQTVALLVRAEAALPVAPPKSHE